MRMRLGLLQDHTAIDRQIAREAAEAQAKRAKADIPTVKTETQTKADELAAARAKEKGSEKPKSASQLKPKIRPLSEAKAIDSGANFISETFLFTVGLSLIILESLRSRRKETTRRVDVAAKLDELEERDRIKTKMLEDLEHELHELRDREKSSITYWFKTKNHPHHNDHDLSSQSTSTSGSKVEEPRQSEGSPSGRAQSSEYTTTTPPVRLSSRDSR